MKNSNALLFISFASQNNIIRFKNFNREEKEEVDIKKEDNLKKRGKAFEFFTLRSSLFTYFKNYGKDI
nr:hypothetical protein [uncultured Prevotella sp.]